MLKIQSALVHSLLVFTFEVKTDGWIDQCDG